jgi:hypothetical protein
MLRHALTFALGLALVGCVPTQPADNPSDDDDTLPGDDDTGPGDDDAQPTDICDGSPNEIVCDGDTAVTCDAAGDIASTEDCDVANDFHCWFGIGCVQCYPGTTWCEGDDVVECAGDGQSYSVIQTCDTANGDVCDGGQCVSLCYQAEQTRSSIGCKFYGVDMEQYPGYESLQYAIVVSNVSETLVARVNVERKDAGTWVSVDAAEIQAQNLAIFSLQDRQSNGTSLNIGGAYRVTSSIPVIAYQFNPLDNGSCTSDASLLLPASAFDTVYVATAWGSQVPGFGVDSSEIDIVAEVDGTQVTITPSVATAAGAGIAPGLAGNPMPPITLDEGDVLQIVNDPTNATGQNLEGTMIEATERVAVFGGHRCANIPHGVTCCDHVEEMVFGLQTWGVEYVGARMPTRTSPPEVSVWHFLAGDVATILTFSASAEVTGLPPGNTLTLAAGQSVEFQIAGSVFNPGDFVVTGTEAFLVTQYMAGEDVASGVSTGDPCMVQSVPVEQYLDNYVVLVPNSWDPDHMTLSRTPGETIVVDGNDVDFWPAWSEIVTITPDWEVVRIDVEDGQHVLAGSAPFGVIISGADGYDSYCYPGGLNQQIINDL